MIPGPYLSLFCRFEVDPSFHVHSDIIPETAVHEKHEDFLQLQRSGEHRVFEMYNPQCF